MTNSITDGKKGRTVQIYKAQSDDLKKKAIATDVNAYLETLKKPKRMRRDILNDTEATREICLAYMQRCADIGRTPNMAGLSSELGISRQWLYEFMRKYPDHDTTVFLEQAREAFADVLIQSALYRHTSEAMAIFVLKNTAGMSDRVDLGLEQITDNNPLGYLSKAEELERRIMESVVDIDD